MFPGIRLTIPYLIELPICNIPFNSIDSGDTNYQRSTFDQGATFKLQIINKYDIKLYSDFYTDLSVYCLSEHARVNNREISQSSYPDIRVRFGNNFIWYLNGVVQTKELKKLTIGQKVKACGSVNNYYYENKMAIRFDIKIVYVYDSTA